MKIAVMGAGGVGGYVGGRLAEVGEEVHLLARGAHLRALRAHGLRIESPYGDAHIRPIAATDDPSAIGPVDLVLFTVKLFDTAAAAERLAPLIGEGTRIVTLQNGIDSAAMIARYVAAERIAAGCIYVSASIGEPGVIRSPGGARRMIVDGLRGDPAIADFVAACARAPGLEACAMDVIVPAIWEKFVALSAFSAATCLARQPIGVVLENCETLDLLRRLLDENVAVARAAGNGSPGRDRGERPPFLPQPALRDQILDADRPRGREAARDALARGTDSANSARPTGFRPPRTWRW